MRKTDLELDRERRNQILDGALHCFLQLGYAKTTMDYVAMNANLSRPLNDLDEKFHNMVDLIIEDPSIADVIDAPMWDFLFIFCGYVLMHMLCVKGMCLIPMNGQGGYTG